MSNRNAQVTIFIIVGIIILAAALSLIYFSSSLKEKKTEEIIKETQKIPTDLEPLVNYMESCIEKVTKRGFSLLGKQGGVIYRSQGGRSLDAPDNQIGTMFLEYGAHKVIYLIDMPIGDSIQCAPDPPQYPVRAGPYPYAEKPDGSPDFSEEKRYNRGNCFGKANPTSINAMTKSLEVYLENNIETACNLSSFRQFSVNAKEPDAKIEPKSGTTYILVSYPLTLTNINTGAETSIDEFKNTIKFSFKEICDFTDTILQADVDNPTYDIRRSVGGFKVTVMPDVYNQDDVVKISSDTILLDGSPFEFVFARKNRYPILEYIYNHSFDEVPLQWKYQINWSDVILQDLTAVDPDEDDVNISVIIGANTLTPIELKEIVPYFISQNDATYLDFLAARIIASDGQYEDYWEYEIT